MTDKKAVHINIDWSDGTEWIAEGDQAALIMKWYLDCEQFLCIRGVRYSGPQFTIIDPNKE
jgi:hypothetical protein